VLENAVDRAHFHYVHDCIDLPRTDAAVDGDGHTFRTISRATARFLGLPIDATVEITFRGAGLATTRLAAPASILVVSSTTPIDEQHVEHRNSFWIDRAVPPVIRSVVGRLAMHRAVQEVDKDVPIWESKSHRSRPVLCDGDGPIMKFRRWYARYLIEQRATP
jgi:3-ketosteroid 9alpha-monooxygenase subunit A